MLIDCDTCTARHRSCGDCVVTALLGAPPGRRGAELTVVPLGRRAPRAAVGAEVHDDRGGPVVSGPLPGQPSRVVEFDEVERRAMDVLAAGGLVPPLRHRPPLGRHVG